VEGLAPTYQLCLDWRLALERGDSTLVFLRETLPTMNFDLQRQIREVMASTELTIDLKKPVAEQRSSATISLYRRALLNLVPRALAGESVLPRLRELEIEIQRECAIEIERHISLLPIKILMPLMFLMFPAYLMLLLGPLISNFLKL